MLALGLPRKRPPKRRQCLNDARIPSELQPQQVRLACSTTLVGSALLESASVAEPVGLRFPADLRQHPERIAWQGGVGDPSGKRGRSAPPFPGRWNSGSRPQSHAASRPTRWLVGSKPAEPNTTSTIPPASSQAGGFGGSFAASWWRGGHRTRPRTAAGLLSYHRLESQRLRPSDMMETSCGFSFYR